MRHILYVGKQKNRPDDVLKTLRLWEKAGSVVDVEDSEAKFYTQHPGEWREISDAELANLETAKQRAEEVVSNAETQWAECSLLDLIALRDKLNTAIRERESETDSRQVIDTKAAEVASSEPPKFSSANPATAAASVERSKKIIEAIQTLDVNDPEDWAKSPRHMPRGTRVSEVVGFKVSQEEVLDALTLMQLPKAA